MTKAEAEVYRDRYAMAKNRQGEVVGPWKSEFDGMAKKTCVRQLSKLMPKGTELSVALMVDDAVRVDIDPGMAPELVSLTSSAPTHPRRRTSLPSRFARTHTRAVSRSERITLHPLAQPSRHDLRLRLDSRPRRQHVTSHTRTVKASVTVHEAARHARTSAYESSGTDELPAPRPLLARWSSRTATRGRHPSSVRIGHHAPTRQLGTPLNPRRHRP